MRKSGTTDTRPTTGTMAQPYREQWKVTEVICRLSWVLVHGVRSAVRVHGDRHQKRAISNVHSALLKVEVWYATHTYSGGVFLS